MRFHLPKSRGVLLVAVLALLLGAFGSAGASQAASLSAKQVKKIAAKVVAKQAPKLSVAHAATADSATNATNAANAANAAQLSGAPASTYLDRAAHENLTSDTALVGSVVTQVMNPTPITVPAGVKYLHITGTATFFGGNTDVSFWPALDGTCAASGAAFEHRARGNTSAGLVTLPVDFLAAVSAGDHSVRMCGAGTLATTISNRSMTAETVAGGATG